MSQKVTIYTAPGCGYCLQAKRFLAENGIQYREVDVADNPDAAREIVRRTGKYGVPVIEVGSTLVVGFDRRRLEGLLEAAYGDAQ